MNEHSILLEPTKLFTSPAGTGASSEAPAPPPASRYDVIAELGRGGMGRVTLVRDRQIGRRIAMKQLLAPKASQGQVARFVVEAQATGQLEHPNIVPVYDVGVASDDSLFFTMKFIQGVSMRHVLVRLARREAETLESYTLTRLLQIFVQVCNGVAFANAKGVVHRDLKPDNIMLGDFGEALVVDWGLAKLLGQRSTPEPDPHERVRASALETVAGFVAGTPAYMAPEQARGQVDLIDARTDVYALGAILYEILTLTPPFTSTDPRETIRSVAGGEPIERPERRAAEGHAPWRVARELSAIAMKALATDRDARYATARDLADDVQRYLEGRSVSAAPDGVWRRAAKFVRRNRSAVLVAVGALVATILAVFAGVTIYERAAVANAMAEGNALFEEAKARYGATVAAVGDRIVDEGELRRSAEQRRLYRTRLQQAAGRFESALDYDADNAAARRALADVAIEMWRTAEADANAELMELYAREVERYAPGVYTTELRGMARLRLTASVADADAYIYRYVPVGEQRRLLPAPYDLATGETGEPSEQFSALAENRLGPLPVDRELAPGAYVVVIRKAGYRETIVPASLARGGLLELSPALLREEEIPAGFVYVPAFRPRLYGPFPRSKSAAYVSVPVGPFFLQEREVTFGDYAEYLDDLIARGGAAEAMRRIPRDFGFVYMQIEGGKVAWNRAVAVDGWRKWPLRGVSWNDAQAYAAWRGERDGRRYRLPTEDEWEAAARGGDGRRYSWGDTFWPQAAKLTQVYNATPGGAPPPADAPFADVSPFGARDMAGSVAEWCADTVAAGLGRVASAGGANGSEYAIRGNAWALTPVALECTFRSSGPADYFHSTVGFRLAADLDERAR